MGLQKTELQNFFCTCVSVFYLNFLCVWIYMYSVINARNQEEMGFVIRLVDL